MFLISVSVSLLNLTSVFDELTMRLGEDHLSYSFLKCKKKKKSCLLVIKLSLSCSSDVTDMADGATPSDDHLPPPPPQVRAPDDGRDLLTCGQCSRAFPLAHILAFIQHKQGGCRSRNQAPNTNATPPSPANRTQQRVANAEPGPGFIELRRGRVGGDQAWGEEPGVRAERNKAGERRRRRWQVAN